MTPQISLSIPQFKPKVAPSGIWGGLSWGEGGELLESARCDLHNKWDTKAERRLLSHSHWPLGTMWSSIMMIIMMRICSSKQGDWGRGFRCQAGEKGSWFPKSIGCLYLTKRERERERRERCIVTYGKTICKFCCILFSCSVKIRQHRVCQAGRQAKLQAVSQLVQSNKQITTTTDKQG